MAKRKSNPNADRVSNRKSERHLTEPINININISRYRRKVVCTFVGVGLVPVLAILLRLFIAIRDEKSGEPRDETLIDSRIPRIDRVDEDLDPERENQVRDFLNNFVCNYRPITAEMAGENTQSVDIEGYCHPRLSAEPHLRTQRVSMAITKKNHWWRPISDATNRDDGILAGELVMRLPRPLQIWDLDALRDKYIQHEFFGLDDNGNSDGRKKGARHKDTQNPLDSGAYLAVYLIRLLHSAHAEKAEQTCIHGDENCEMWEDMHQLKERVQILSPYLDILPSIKDRQRESNLNPHSHPLFWSSSLVESLFPRYTYTYDLIRHYQQMIESEYAALALVSNDFKRNVNNAEYLSMRINVLSRAFGVSASTNDNGVLWDVPYNRKDISLRDEMRLYETSNFGSFLDVDHEKDARGDVIEEFKFRSMCPLLDMYNSHPNPNVIWRYDSRTSSYLVHANKNSNIPPNHSIVVSYGKYSDGHLFGKYGYVNGDGTSPTEISLAVFHRLLGDVGLGRQFSQLPFDILDPWSRETKLERNISGHEFAMAKKSLDIQAKELIRYLMFDDGYKDCIDLNNTTNSHEEELKLLKMQHLMRIANNRSAWVIRIPPKFPRALPQQTDGFSTPEKKGDKKAVRLNAENIISTCRLLSLTANDIGGNAVGFLRESLIDDGTKNYFRLGKNTDALEFRALMCVVRLCNVALGRYMNHDTTEPEIVGSATWNAWYIVSGETRALGILIQTAANEANKIKQKYLSSLGRTASSDAAMKVREEGACPLDYSLPILNKLNIR